jgi:hypothetical protein
MRPILKWEGPEAEKNPLHLTQVKIYDSEQGEVLKAKFDLMDAGKSPNLLKDHTAVQTHTVQQPEHKTAIVRKATTFKFSSSTKFKIK